MLDHGVLGSGGWGKSITATTVVLPAHGQLLRSSIILDIYWDQLSIPSHNIMDTLWGGIEWMILKNIIIVKLNKIRQFSIKS